MVNKNEGLLEKVNFPDGLSNELSPFRKVFTLYTDKDGYIWLGTLSHLIRFNPSPKDQSFISYRYGHLENINIRTITQDSAKTLWIGTEGNGLFKLNPNSSDFEKGKLISVPIPGPDTVYNGYNVINKILPDDEERTLDRQPMAVD